MKFLLTCLGLAIAAALGGLAFLYSGVADVAASTPHWALTRWVLSTAMERSVERHAAGITPPPGFDSDEHVREGAREYDEMCAVCHGAPGRKHGHIGAGLNPEPPEFAEESGDEWSAAELFWVTQHGVRMTGMPAFGRSHKDAELWDVVALLKRLPHLSAQQYQALLPPRAAGSSGASQPPEQ
jgi:mono/diheme cytochrome c family protein